MALQGTLQACAGSIGLQTSSCSITRAADFLRRGTGRSARQTSQAHRSRRWGFCRTALVNIGSASLCLLKSRQHDAFVRSEVARVVEAYGRTTFVGDCAASHPVLDLSILQMYQCHSACDQHWFCNHFHARLNAFQLRCQVTRDRWKDGMFDFGSSVSCKEACSPGCTIRQPSPKTVSFDPKAVLLLQHTSDSRFHTQTFTHDQFQRWDCKP